MRMRYAAFALRKHSPFTCIRIGHSPSMSMRMQSHFKPKHHSLPRPLFSPLHTRANAHARMALARWYLQWRLLCSKGTDRHKQCVNQKRKRSYQSSTLTLTPTRRTWDNGLRGKIWKTGFWGFFGWTKIGGFWCDFGWISTWPRKKS